MYYLSPPLEASSAALLQARADRFAAWVNTKRGRNGWASYKPDEIPAELRDVDPTNDEKSLLDLCKFHSEPPARLFCYVTQPRLANGTHGSWQCRNFPGALYGLVNVGPQYKSPGFYRASTRRSVALFAVNGWVYSGTLYES